MKIHYNLPEEIRLHIWQELVRATQDRHHSWRTPVLATVGSDAAVQARTVVLRKVNEQEQTLEIYTDSRSLKVTQLQDQSQAILVFWSTRLNWQLRVRVQVTVLTTGPYVEALWKNVQHTASSADYLTLSAPGTALDNTEAQSEHHRDKNFFCVLRMHIVEIDWLELSRQGHRRARLTQSEWEWLVP